MPSCNLNQQSKEPTRRVFQIKFVHLFHMTNVRSYFLFSLLNIIERTDEKNFREIFPQFNKINKINSYNHKSVKLKVQIKVSMD